MLRNDLKPYILLSILPLVYLANTLETALFMGLVYMLLALVIYFAGSLIERFSEGRIKLYIYIILAAGLITVTMTVLNTYFTLNQFMGIYLALTLFVLPQLKADALSKEKALPYVLMIGLGFVLLLVIGFLREFLGTGSITLLAFGIDTVQVFSREYAIAILNNASGGFILAGFIFAAVQAISFERVGDKDVI